MDDYRKVGEDIFGIYEAVNSQPHVQDTLRKRSVSTAKDEAIEFRQAAENYDPHKWVLKKISTLRNHRSLVTAIILIPIGILYYAVGSVPPFLMTIADWILLSPHRTGGGFLALVIGLWIFYVLSLKANRWITQRMNRELRYYGPTILACRMEASIRSYRMWNRSLNKPYTLSCLGLVTIGRTISPRAYSGAMNIVKAYLPPITDSIVAVYLD